MFSMNALTVLFFGTAIAMTGLLLAFCVRWLLGRPLPLPGTLPRGHPRTSGARPDDGLLDIALLMPPGRLSWIPLAWALVRQQPTPPLLEFFRASRLHVTSPHHHLCELDGELLTATRTLTATIRPSALWVCTPAHALMNASLRPAEPSVARARPG